MIKSFHWGEGFPSFQNAFSNDLNTANLNIFLDR